MAESQVGYLTDSQMMEYLSAGQLLKPETWDSEQVRHASYTLRLGHEVRVRDPADGAPGVEVDFKVRSLNLAEEFAIAPGCTAMLYSEEVFRLPADILGFTVARGLLFTEGLSPENTYVDPGFQGSIYTVVTNTGSRTLLLRRGMPIARVFFYKLNSKVEREYRSGPSLGIAQSIESLPTARRKTRGELRALKSSALIDELYGDSTSREILNELVRRIRAMIVASVVLAIASPLLFRFALSHTVRDKLGGFLASVAAGIVATAIWFVISAMLRRFRRNLNDGD